LQTLHIRMWGERIEGDLLQAALDSQPRRPLARLSTNPAAPLS
jgi:hypothetical protein